MNTDMQGLPEATKAKIESQLASSKIVLYMKGTTSFPQCGFSARAVALLQHYGAQFVTFDVLEDNEIRDGIKIYGNWPTIPQLYINKKLIGGADIMMEMYETGELGDLVRNP